MTAPPNRRFKMPRTVWAVGWVSLFTDVSTEMIYPLLPFFLIGTLGASVAFVGLVEGVAESTASLFKMWSGWRSDRLKQRKPLMVFGYGLSASTRPIIALATLGGHVLVARFIDRIGKGIRTAPRDALLAASVPPEQRGAAFGVQRSMDHAGAVIGPFIAWLLLQQFTGNYRLVFWAAIIPMFGAMTVLIFGTTEKPTPVPETLGKKTPFLLTPRFKNYLAALFLFTLGNSSDAFLLIRAQQCGVPTIQLPLLWMVLHIVKSASSFPGGLISDRLGRKSLILGGWGIYVLTYAGFGNATRYWHIWALFIVYGLFHGMTESAEKAWVAEFFPDSQRGRAFGIFNAVTGIGALPASLLMGWIWTSYGANAAFMMGAAFALTAAIWLLIKVPSSISPHSRPVNH